MCFIIRVEVPITNHLRDYAREKYKAVPKKLPCKKIEITAVKSPLYLIEKIARWSIVSCALGLACRPFVSKKKRKEKKRKEKIKNQEACKIFGDFIPLTLELQ
jgi:hypothetical protein